VSASPSLPCSKDKVIAFLRRSFSEAFRVQVAACALLRDTFQEYTNRHGIVADMPISARNTFPARTPDRCIDYLFVSRRHLMVDAAAVPNIVLSDHRPVLATMHVGP
jgi:endonuclease/exonuclease/phosphatase family metal-dependent hydrolase